MATNGIEIYVMDMNFDILDIVQDAESIIWEKSYVDAGSFEVYVPATEDNAALFLKDRCIVRRDDDMVGVIETINIQSDDDGNQMMTVSGRCAKSLFSRRIINKMQTFTGTVWNRMYWMLYYHAVNPSASNRQIPNMAIADIDTDKGLSASTQHTGTNLMDAVIDLLESNNFGWKVVLQDGALTAIMYSGNDRSTDQSENVPVIFSDALENLSSSDYLLDMTEYANIAVIAGEGEGSARTWTGVDITGTASGTMEGLNRYELFVDARDLQSEDDDGTALSSSEYIQTLQARGLEKLQEVAQTETFEGSVDAATYVYREDYDVGDIVEIRTAYGLKATARIESVTETDDGDGYTVEPTFGDFTITSLGD